MFPCPALTRSAEQIRQHEQQRPESVLWPARCLHRRFAPELLHRRDGRLPLYHGQHRRAAVAGHRPQARRDAAARGSRGATACRRSRATSPCRWRCCRPSARWRCWCSSARSRHRSSTSSMARPFMPTLATLVSLTAGTMFLVWLGELITENGIGNGISLIIFANIMVKIPQTIGSALVSSSGSRRRRQQRQLIFSRRHRLFVLAMTFAMVMVYLAQRRVPVQYPTKRRFLSGSAAADETTYIPLQVNSAGMIPLIFASPSCCCRRSSPTSCPIANNARLKDFFTDVRTLARSLELVVLGHLWRPRRALHLLLRHRRLGAAEHGRELAEAGRVHPWHPPRAAHARLSRQDSVSHHAGRRGLPGHRRGRARALEHRNSSTQVLQAASLLIVVGVVLDTVKQLAGADGHAQLLRLPELAVPRARYTAPRPPAL